MPDFVKRMWEEAPKHPARKRMRETQIINNYFSKVGNTWVVDTKKPFFEEGHKKSSTAYADDAQIAKPRDVWAEEFRDGPDTKLYCLVDVCLIVLPGCMV